MKHGRNNTRGLTIRFDSIGGASGDLILSSLCALGANHLELQKKLASLSFGHFKLKITSKSDRGFSGKQICVKIPHDHGHHHHHHRCLKDIFLIINKSRLSPWVKDLSAKVFRRLAEAEAKVHNTTPDKIHFHEVGAIDSIIDIIGSCIALEMLGVESVVVGPLPIGYGTVECAHGTLPLPAPAVVELLKGHPVVQIDEPFETVTPTGAALLMAWKEQLATKTPVSQAIIRTGLGFGHHEYNHRSNTLRATLLKPAKADDDLHDECLVMECNLDDTIPELIGAATRDLLDKGALDVFTTPVFMKKQRPGVMLTILCRPADRETMLASIFSSTTTFGIREHLASRTILARRHETAKTPYGKVGIKVGTWKGRDITFSPEYSDCVKCAKKYGVPVRTVYEKAVKAIGKK